MTRRIEIANANEIPVGQGRAYPVESRMIAVFNDDGTFRAIDDFCPHQGASLAEGHLEDGAVACPWHAWRFRVSDGAWLDCPRIRVASYPMEREGDRLFVLLPDEG